MSATVSKYKRPYFCFNPSDQKAADFVKKLQVETGTFTIEESDIIVDVGGDGTILYGFQNLPNRQHFGLKPPTSNSTMFHGHANIDDGETLSRAFNSAVHYIVEALEADIHLSNDKTVTIKAYGDIIVSAMTAQASLVNVRMENSQQYRLMSGGLIVATPLGSTARNKSAGGEILALNNKNQVMLTSDGRPLSDPDGLFQEGCQSRLVNIDAGLEIHLQSRNKRPSVIHFDSQTVMPDGQIFTGLPFTVQADPQITGVVIRSAPEHSCTLLRNEIFATHSF